MLRHASKRIGILRQLVSSEAHSWISDTTCSGLSTSASNLAHPGYELDMGYEAAKLTTDWSVPHSALDSMDPIEYGLGTASIGIGEPAPNFSGDAVIDSEVTELQAAEYAGRWVLLFFYPKDFTFVCPTEIIAFSDAASKFAAKNCAVIGASTDSAEVHLAWINTPRKAGGLGPMKIPLLADVTRRVSRAYGVLGPKNFPFRGIFLIDPKGNLKAMQMLHNDVGRSVDEAERLLDAFQYVEENGVVCPANWKPGDATMVPHPEHSLDYFAAAATSQEEADVVGAGLDPLSSPSEYFSAINTSIPVVVSFSAPWCGKCRMISPHVDMLRETHGGVKFYKFDTSVAALEALTADLGVSALPVFKFFKEGKEVLPQVVGYKKQPLSDAVKKIATL